MNVEQLHSVCEELKQELTDTNLLERLQNLEQALQQTVNQPNQVEYQEQVGNNRNELTVILKAIEDKDRPVMKRQIIAEIGGTNLLGGDLLRRIEAAFTQVEVTPSLVQKDIAAIRSELADFAQGIEELLAGLSKFGIGKDALEPYVAELGVIIPRRQNVEDLGVFAKDIVKINRELQAFVELVTGRAETLRVRSISSSDFAIFVELFPEIAKIIVATIGFLLWAYDKLLDIRTKRSELRQQDAPQQVIDEMDRWAESLMEEQVNKITDDLMDQFKDIERPAGRSNELEGHVRMSVKKLAGRLDVGYHFSARIGDIPAEDTEDTEEPEDERKRKEGVVQSIKEGGSRIAYREMPGDPVLPLKWQPNSDDDDAEE